MRQRFFTVLVPVIVFVMAFTMAERVRADCNAQWGAGWPGGADCGSVWNEDGCTGLYCISGGCYERMVCLSTQSIPNQLTCYDTLTNTWGYAWKWCYPHELQGFRQCTALGCSGTYWQQYCSYTFCSFFPISN